ncbi:hypothetical protein AKJ16_DCAP06479 [Drosera capensis]
MDPKLKKMAQKSKLEHSTHQAQSSPNPKPIRRRRPLISGIRRRISTKSSRRHDFLLPLELGLHQRKRKLSRWTHEETGSPRPKVPELFTFSCRHHVVVASSIKDHVLVVGMTRL